jgi:hypothetical protein
MYSSSAPRLALLLGLAALSIGPLSAAVALAPPEDRTVGDYPAHVHLADVDGNGHADLVSADRDSGRVSVLLADGSGGFSPASAFNAGASPVWLDSGDFDGDGDLDLAVATAGDDAIAVLPGDGSGGFGTPAVYPGVKSPQWVACGDVDGDGDPDLVTSDSLPSAPLLRVLRGKGDGTFVASASYPTGTHAGSGLLHDLDGDGRLDVVVASRTENAVYVRLGDGLGGFGPATVHDVDSQPGALIAFDTDGDGVVDLVTANRVGNSVSVLPGLGAGSFGTRRDYPAGSRPVGLVVGDFDTDCALDLAVTESNTARVAVLPGDGLGAYGPAETVAVGNNPTAVAVGDLDGDLQFDLAVANADDDTVSVLLGNAPAGCTTFYVRRSTDPASLHDAPVHYVAGESPFDDDPGTLSDGESYFYRVEHAAGLPLRHSVGLNPAVDAVRLGFNDADPANAPVGPAASTVTTDSTTVPADGTTPAIVRIVPRDADGVALGAGLRIQAEVSPSGGAVLEPVRDLASGGYEVALRSSSPGTVRVAVQVEGLTLDATATVIFTTP